MERIGSLLRRARPVVPFVVGVGFLLAWSFTPVGEHLRPWLDSLAEVRDLPVMPLIVVVVFLAGGLLVMPHTALVLGTVVGFGPWRGGAYAMAGSLVSALALFLIGRWCGGSLVERALGPRAAKVNAFLGRRGVAAVAVVRNLPLAPFSLVNLAAGASGVTTRDFLLGTFLGLLPSLTAIAVFGESLVRLTSGGGARYLVLLAPAALLLVGAALAVRRAASRRTGAA